MKITKEQLKQIIKEEIDNVKIEKITNKIKNTRWESLDNQMAADMKAKYIRKLTSAGRDDPENYFIAVQSGKI
jgi:hypothetical protein